MRQRILVHEEGVVIRDIERPHILLRRRSNTHGAVERVRVSHGMNTIALLVQIFVNLENNRTNPTLFEMSHDAPCITTQGECIEVLIHGCRSTIDPSFDDIVLGSLGGSRHLRVRLEISLNAIAQGIVEIGILRSKGDSAQLLLSLGSNGSHLHKSLTCINRLNGGDTGRNGKVGRVSLHNTCQITALTLFPKACKRIAIVGRCLQRNHVANPESLTRIGMRCTLGNEPIGSRTRLLRILIWESRKVGIVNHILHHHVRQHRICHAHTLHEAPCLARASLLYEEVNGSLIARVGERYCLATVCHHTLHIIKHGITLAKPDDGIIPVTREVRRSAIKPVNLVRCVERNGHAIHRRQPYGGIVVELRTPARQRINTVIVIVNLVQRGIKHQRHVNHTALHINALNVCHRGRIAVRVMQREPRGTILLVKLPSNGKLMVGVGESLSRARDDRVERSILIESVVSAEVVCSTCLCILPTSHRPSFAVEGGILRNKHLMRLVHLRLGRNATQKRICVSVHELHPRGIRIANGDIREIDVNTIPHLPCNGEGGGRASIFILHEVTAFVPVIAVASSTGIQINTFSLRSRNGDFRWGISFLSYLFS